jgi:CPA1 family monovalent cation:H+ antiporter
VQGLTLPPLVRFLGVQDDGTGELEEMKARRQAAEAGARRLEEIAREDWASAEAVADLRAHYHERKRLYADGVDGDTRTELEREAVSQRRIRRELLDAERSAIIRLRNEGTINDEVLHLIERDLDLEAQSLRS